MVLWERSVVTQYKYPLGRGKMNSSDAKSIKIVDTYLQGNSTIQAEMPVDIAKHLRDKKRAGSVGKMTPRLRRALRGGERLFQYREGGQNFFETYEARRLRCHLPKGTPKADVIKGIVRESALV